MGKPSEAADRYIEYINRFPDGERIETAHLNAIDTLREAGRIQEASAWITRTRQSFAGTVTETNALFAQLRLEISESNWKRAMASADELSRRSFSKAVATSPTEVAYLKAYSLERSGRDNEAFAAYLAVPGGIDSYYGWLASDRLINMADSKQRLLLAEHTKQNAKQAALSLQRYPHPFLQAILIYAQTKKPDAR